MEERAEGQYFTFLPSDRAHFILSVETDLYSWTRAICTKKPMTPEHCKLITLCPTLSQIMHSCLSHYPCTNMPNTQHHRYTFTAAVPSSVIKTPLYVAPNVGIIHVHLQSKSIQPRDNGSFPIIHGPITRQQGHL